MLTKKIVNGKKMNVIKFQKNQFTLFNLHFKFLSSTNESPVN